MPITAWIHLSFAQLDFDDGAIDVRVSLLPRSLTLDPRHQPKSPNIGQTTNYI